MHDAASAITSAAFFVPHSNSGMPLLDIPNYFAVSALNRFVTNAPTIESIQRGGAPMHAGLDWDNRLTVHDEMVLNSYEYSFKKYD